MSSPFFPVLPSDQVSFTLYTLDKDLEEAIDHATSDSKTTKVMWSIDNVGVEGPPTLAQALGQAEPVSDRSDGVAAATAAAAAEGASAGVAKSKKQQQKKKEVQAAARKAKV